MTSKNRFGVVFKAISVIITAIFLFDQIAFAGDLINAALEQQYKEQSQIFAPEYLQSQQASAESLISQKQTAEDAMTIQNLTHQNEIVANEPVSIDLKGPVAGSVTGLTSVDVVFEAPGEGDISQYNESVTVTTDSGDTIHYFGGAIMSVVKQDGTIIRNIELGQDNNLINAEIVKSDGLVLTVQDRVLKTLRDTDGVVTSYNNAGFITSQELPSGKILNYLYSINATNEVIKTIITGPDYSAEYGKDLRLSKVIKKDGEIIEYSQGVISKVKKADGNIFLFMRSSQDACNVIVNTYIGKDGRTIKFDDSLNILSISARISPALPMMVTTFYGRGSPIVTQAQNYIVTYNDLSEPVYVFNGAESGSLAACIMEMEKAIKERMEAERSLADKEAILQNAKKANTAAYSIYTDAQIKLNNAIKARQVLESNYIYLSSGAVKIGGNYTYSKGVITVRKASGFVQYDAQGRLITDDLGNGVVASYIYENTGIIKTTLDNFDSKASSLLTASIISGGKLYIKEDPSGAQNSFNRYCYDYASSIPVYSIDFSIDNQDADLRIGLKRNNNTDDKKRDQISLFAADSNILVQIYKDGLSTVAAPILKFKTNTEYTARFEVGTQDIKVYVWEKNKQKPEIPSYVWSSVSWDAYSSTKPAWNRAFFGSIGKGGATLDNFSISYYNNALASNSTILKLKNALEKESAAQALLINTDARYKDTLAPLNAAQNIYDDAFSIFETAKAKEAIAVSGKIDLENSLISNRVLFNLSPLAQTDYSNKTYIANPSAFCNEILKKLDFSRVSYSSDNSVNKVTAPDGSKIELDKQGLPVLSSISGFKADYSYLTGICAQMTDFQINRDGIQRIYDIKGNLNAVITQDNARIGYDGGAVSSIISPDGIKRIYRAGTLSELIDVDGSRFIFGNDGRPVSAEDKYGGIYYYTYMADKEDGKDMTLISDPSHGVTRYYKDNLLIRTIEMSGLCSYNGYSDDGRLKDVTVKKHGAVVIRYDYSYKIDGNTEVKDSEGNIRTYTPDGRIAFFSGKDGHLYKYIYPDLKTTRVEYVAPLANVYLNTLPDDFVVAQEFLDDKLKKVCRANGTVTVYTDSGKPDYIMGANQQVCIDYDYDSEGDLAGITMCDARRSLIAAVDAAKSGINDNKKRILADIKKQLNDFIIYFEKTNFSRLTSQDSAVRQQAIDDFIREYKVVYDESVKAQLKIEEEARQQVAKIENESDRLLLEIIRQEITPLIIHYYKRLLGRDPDSAEMDLFLDKASLVSQNIDKIDIVKYIFTSDEYGLRKARIESIKSRVRLELENYIKLTVGTERDEFLAKLRLADQDAAELDRYDLDAILKWLDSQSMHFGDSAFLALKDLLKNNGIETDLSELAANVILIDVLTGAIDSFTSGDLQLSMYGMSKYAESKGLVLYNEKLVFEDLVLQIRSSANPIIAHIDGNHYILITGIDGEKIYYKEENRGAAGTSEVMLKEEFTKKWSGHVVSRTKIQDEKKILTASEAKKIRGAFFWFIIPFIAAVVSAVTAIVSTVASIIASVISAAATAVSAIAGMMVTIGAQLASGISAIFNGVGTAVGNFFSTSIVGLAARTITGIGLNLGISKGMQALGISSTISDLTASFLTGGALSIINPVQGISALGAFVSEGFKFATITGINELGTKLRLDTNLTSIISITSGSLVDGLWQGNIGEIAIKIAPNIASEFAYYGLGKLCKFIGVSDYISYVAGMGLKSAINTSLAREFQPNILWDSAQNGLLQGITSVALDWMAEEIGASLLVKSLTSAAIAGGVESLLLGQDPVKGIFDTYFRAGIGLLTLGADQDNDPLSRSVYLSKLLDLNRVVEEKGIVKTLEAYSAGFLGQQTIVEIWKHGGIAELFKKPKQIEITTNRKGETVKRIYTMDIKSESDKLISNFIDLSPTSNMLIGFREGNIITHCEFVIGPDGRPQLKNGEREIFNPDGSERIEYVDNFNLNKIDYIDNYGTRIGYYVPIEGASSISIGSDGVVSTGKFISLITDYSVATKSGQVTYLNLARRYIFSENQRANMIKSGYTDEYLAGFKEVVNITNGVLKYFVIPPDTKICSISETVGREWLSSIEADGKAFWQGVYDLLRDTVEGDQLPQLSPCSLYPYADIELNLILPGRSEGIIACLGLLNIVAGNIASPSSYFINQNSTWNYNTSYSARIYAASFDMGYKLVFGGGAKFLLSGEGPNWLDWEKLNTFYNALNTTNTIGVGFSADTVSIAKSWLIPNSARADHYFLFSPQLSPKELQECMKIGGISPDMVTVVETSGDFPREWLSGFSDNIDSNKIKKWDYVKIMSGPGITLSNPFLNHGIPVKGVLEGGQYIVEVNGVRSSEPVNIADIYSYFVNRNNSK